MVDLYEILGIDSNANEKEIKKAYSKRLRIYTSQKNPEEYKEIVRAYETLSDPKRRKQYDTYFKHGPEIEEYRNKSIEAFNKGDYKTAIRECKKILIIDPQLLDIKYRFAICLAYDSQYELALGQIKELIDLDPTDAKYYVEMARLYGDLNDNLRKEASFLKAYSIDDNYNIGTEIIAFYMENNNYDKAILFLERCIGKNSDDKFQDFSYYLEMIKVYYKSNNIKDIKNIIARIKEITPDNKKQEVSLKINEFIEDAFKDNRLEETKVFCENALELYSENEYARDVLEEINNPKVNQQENYKEEERINNNYESGEEENIVVEDSQHKYNNDGILKNFILGGIEVLVFGMIGLQLGIGILAWLFVYLPLKRKYDISKKGKSQIPYLFLKDKIIGYLIILGMCLLVAIGGPFRSEYTGGAVGILLGYIIFCLLLHKSSDNCKDKHKSFSFKNLIEKLGINSNLLEHIKPEMNLNEAKDKMPKIKSLNLRKIGIIIIAIVAIIAFPTIGYIGAMKLYNSKLQNENDNIEASNQSDVKDFEVTYDGELQYVGDEISPYINATYYNNVKAENVPVEFLSSNENIVTINDKKLVAVDVGKATITVKVGTKQKDLYFNIKGSKKDSSDNTYLSEESSSKYLSRSYLETCSKETLALIKNEIYAKKGYIFKEEPYKTYFKSKSWYNGVYDSVTDLNLNEYELYNVNLINEILDVNNTKSDVKEKQNQVNSISYKTYTNNRYGFSIDYPSNLIAGVPPTNGDGLSFKNNDNTVSLTVYGSNNALNKTTKEIYMEDINSLKVVPMYKTLSDNFYVLSWEENGKIYYKDLVVGGQTGSINSFIISYPSSEDENYTPVVERMYNSFKTPGINKGH